MPSMSITIERTPLTLQWEGQDIQVEQLGIRLPFARKPGVEVCARCHSLSIQRMEAKFGKRDDCVSCHPYHQSPLHGRAYEYRMPSNKTDL